MWVLAGLGNPGKGYAGNRHNIGFMAIDRLAEAHRFPVFTQRFKGLLSAGEIGGERIILFKPQTFMNLSGEGIGELVRFYRVPPEQLVVFHDELDLPLGKLRVKQGGGNGGHNGLKSIDAHVGTDYWRVRLGIGHPGTKEAVTGHVLGDFAKEELPIAERQLDAIAANIKLLLAGDDAAFMTKMALGMNAEKI